jgi:hypothetical protein
MALVKFGSYEVQAATEERQELEAGSAAEFMKLKPGRNVVRVLPPPQGKRSPFRTVYQHFIQTPTGPIVFVCPRLEKKEPCPACQKADELRGARNEEDQRLANELFARRRVFTNCIDRAEPEKGPKVLGFGKTIHEQLIALREDEDAGGEFTHPISGFDIIIERAGSGKNDTKYSVRPARQSSQLHEDASVMQAWIDGQRNLDQFARVPSWDELRDMMAGKKRERGEAPAQDRRAALPAREERKPRKSIGDEAFDTEGEYRD